MTSFWYLATPYSKFPGGIEAAYRAACGQAALLIRAGIPVFCPIAHTHGPAVFGGIDPRAHDLWMRADRPFMGAAMGLIFCLLPSWDVSVGMAEEREAFRAAGKPVVWMAPGRVPDKLRRPAGVAA